MTVKMHDCNTCLSQRAGSPKKGKHRYAYGDCGRNGLSQNKRTHQQPETSTDKQAKKTPEVPKGSLRELEETDRPQGAQSDLEVPKRRSRVAKGGPNIRKAAQGHPNVPTYSFRRALPREPKTFKIGLRLHGSTKTHHTKRNTKCKQMLQNCQRSPERPKRKASEFKKEAKVSPRTPQELR